VPGRFITFEGPEGAGKTLMAGRLAEALRARGHEVRLTREPGGTALGEQIRSVVLAAAQAASDDATIDARADALLFNAARAQLCAEVIQPAIAAGEIVICARFADSTLAYQGYGAGLPIDELRSIADMATAGLSADLTILAREVASSVRPIESRSPNTRTSCASRNAGALRHPFDTDHTDCSICMGELYYVSC